MRQHNAYKFRFLYEKLPALACELTRQQVAERFGVSMYVVRYAERRLGVRCKTKHRIGR